MDAWGPLMELLKDLVDQIQATRGKVSREIIREGFDVEALRPVQIQYLFRLTSLNRFTHGLPSIVRARQDHPFQMYLELSGNAG